MPRATSMGLDALKHIVVQEKLTLGVQYFGLVMENFALTDPKYATAVEVAAQNSLFHIIVDTDETAARLMRRLEKDKLGRVTFLPLNQLSVEGVRYPDSTDVAPLMEECVEFDPAVRKAMVSFVPSNRLRCFILVLVDANFIRCLRSTSLLESC